jgi:hypothetical protein
MPGERQPGSRENLTSFRGVAERHTLDESLGLLVDLPGRWFGSGFNLIARPDFAGGNDLFLELNLTVEMLHFSAIGSPVRNRGSAQGDIDLFGVHYLQQVSDATTHGALHIEPGIWLSIPATEAPEAPPSVARLACVPHGDALNAQGQGRAHPGPPNIKPANTVPFPIGDPEPPPGTPNLIIEYDLALASVFRTNPLPAAIAQRTVDDPNTVLTDALTGVSVLETKVLEVSTAPSGGVENIPFVVENADATFVSATFWIERLQDPSGGTYMQLQYTQTVLLNFLGLHWPHVSVATLVKTF